MNIAKTDLATKVVKHVSLDTGEIHFFNHVAVIEFNEGTHVDLNNCRGTIHELINYFGESRPFGVVANRINSYSVSTLDISDARQAVPNLSAYGIVSYNEAGKMSALIESSFCIRKDICFENLYEGLDTIYKRVQEKISISLN